MRPAERDVLLFPLAMAAGSADGWSYMGLGHAFVANMTGNTVLIGLAVFLNRDFRHPLVSLGCYAVGTMLATLLSRKPPAESPWPRSISFTLLLEAAILVAVEVVWARLGGPGKISPAWVNTLLGSVAFCIGLQSGAMLRLKIPGIVTTYITGTWTTLMAGVAKLAKSPRLADVQNPHFEERLLMQAGILAVYFLSAVATGWLLRYLPAGVGAVPAVSVLLVSIYGLLRG